MKQNDNLATGHLGETLAVNWLQERGYEILHQNWRQGRVEIDLIARQGTRLHFIEVKTGRASRYGMPEQRINPKKMANIQLAAERFLQGMAEYQGIQFDVLSISLQNGRPRYYFMEDIFL